MSLLEKENANWSAAGKRTANAHAKRFQSLKTELEINTTIAVACGWVQKEVEDGHSFSDPKVPIMVTRWVDPNNIPHHKVPDYYNDLNAMWTAETLISEGNIDGLNRGKYLAVLRRLCGYGIMSVTWQNEWLVVNAKSDARARAFVEALQNNTEPDLEPKKVCASGPSRVNPERCTHEALRVAAKKIKFTVRKPI